MEDVRKLTERLTNPEVFAEQFVKSLPGNVQKRVRVLQAMQKQRDQLEKAFTAEMRALEAKYEELYKPLYVSRRELVIGAREPTPEEIAAAAAASAAAAPKADGEEAAPAPAATEEKKPEVEDVADAAGVPKFWLTAFKNCQELEELIQAHDEPVLEKLLDISVAAIEDEKAPGSFRVTFTFAPNEYFANETLTKTFKVGDDEDDGSIVLMGSEGTKVEWKAGKNLTVKMVKKTQRHKKHGRRTIEVEEPQDSFFTFFADSKPSSPGGDDEEDEEDEDEDDAERDFELARFIRDRFVPRAVSYYTGAIAPSFGGYGDDDDEEEGDDDDDDDDESSGKGNDAPPPRGGGGGRGGRGGGGGGAPRPGGKNAPGAGPAGAGAGGQPPDCKPT